MKRHSLILLLTTIFALSSGVALKADANLVESNSIKINHKFDNSETIQPNTIAQSSPWGQVIDPQTYINPDTGQ